VTFMFKYEY